MQAIHAQEPRPRLERKHQGNGREMLSRETETMGRQPLHSFQRHCRQAPSRGAPQWVGMEGAIFGTQTHGREARWLLWDEMRMAHLRGCAQRPQKQVSRSLPMSP